MTELSDEEWQRWLQGLSHPNDLMNDLMNESSFDLGVGAPENDLDEADMLRFLAASPNELDGNPTTEHSWFSDCQQVPGADPKARYPFEQSIDDVHLLVQKLQHELATPLPDSLDETNHIESLQVQTKYDQ